MRVIGCIAIGLFLIGSLLAQGYESLYTDVKAHRVGDVLSVVIVESAQASRESKMKNSSNADMNMDGSVTGNLTGFLPVFGAKGSFDKSYSGADETRQNDRLVGRMAVKIVEVAENGMFKISGKREVEVNGEKNVMKLEGYVRPRDIRTNNVVYSYNIADARITYKKGGISNSIVKPGTFTRLLTLGLTAGLVAAAVMGLKF